MVSNHLHRNRHAGQQLESGPENFVLPDYRAERSRQNLIVELAIDLDHAPNAIRRNLLRLLQQPQMLLPWRKSIALDDFLRHRLILS
jgi:hypothetical protein